MLFEIQKQKATILIKSLELSVELFWSNSKEKGTATIGDSFQQNYVKKMTILFLNWKNTNGTTFTFKNKHPLKNSVINLMKIQFFERRGFCTQQLPSEKKCLRFRHGYQKDGKIEKPTENMKNVKDKGTIDILGHTSRTGFARSFWSRTAFRNSHHTRVSQTMY